MKSINLCSVEGCRGKKVEYALCARHLLMYKEDFDAMKEQRDKNTKGLLRGTILCCYCGTKVIKRRMDMQFCSTDCRVKYHKLKAKEE